MQCLSPDFSVMNTTLPYKEEKEAQYRSNDQAFKTSQPDEGTRSPFRKNSPAPWEPSVLEGIRITSSLSALRAKAKAEMALSQ